jgi:hypothetical protein
MASGLAAQRVNGIDLRRGARRNPAGGEGDRDEDDSSTDERQRVTATFAPSPSASVAMTMAENLLADQSDRKA